jgi:hypothetical protein
LATAEILPWGVEKQYVMKNIFFADANLPSWLGFDSDASAGAGRERHRGAVGVVSHARSRLELAAVVALLDRPRCASGADHDAGRTVGQSLLVAVHIEHTGVERS